MNNVPPLSPKLNCLQTTEASVSSQLLLHTPVRYPPAHTSTVCSSDSRTLLESLEHSGSTRTSSFTVHYHTFITIAALFSDLDKQLQQEYSYLNQ